MGPTINGLRYSGSCPFPQNPIPLRFFEVPFIPFPGFCPRLTVSCSCNEKNINQLWFLF